MRRRINRSFIPSSAPWPFLTAQTISSLLLSTVMFLHYFLYGVEMVFASALALALVLSF